MKFIELSSERLLYRKFRHDDLPIVFDWLGSAENMKYMWKPKSESETREYLDMAVSNAEAEKARS